MGRPRRPLDSVANAKDVRARLKERGLPNWQRQRLQCVQLGLAAKLSLVEIAEEMNVSPRTVGEWFERFRTGGFDSLLSRKEKGRGPASWLNSKNLRDFCSQLAQGKWRRAEEARAWLQDRLGRKLSLVVVYKYLGRFAMRRSGVLLPKQNALAPQQHGLNGASSTNGTTPKATSRKPNAKTLNKGRV